ncbi:MAG: hypothetical protein P9E88_09580 [Candidatus Competibacter sp.]|nr:hypothetical protein [Candidatus Competibacter sp.]
MPHAFAERLTLEFSVIREGSIEMPLGRIVVGKQTLLDFGDEFDEVAELIDAAISVASQDQLLPAEFPRNAIPLFTEFRKKTQGIRDAYSFKPVTENKPPLAPSKRVDVWWNGRKRLLRIWRI